MSKDQQAAEIMEHFGRGFALLMQLSVGNQEATVVIQPEALSAEDAATYIGVSRTRFYEIKKDRIKTTLIEGQPRFLRKHLDAYLKKCEKES